MRLPTSAIWGTVETPLGWAGLRVGPAGVGRVVLPHSSESLTVKELASDDGELSARNQRTLRPWLVDLARALSGERVDFRDWPLDANGATPFQRRVWRACARIPWGQTRSYWWVAVRAGDPRSARAVGQALGANPTPIIVPCHRVLRSDGGLGGFGGGQEMKRCLLKTEGIPVPGRA